VQSAIVTALAVVAAACALGAVLQFRRARRAEAEVARVLDELKLERHAAAHDPLTGLPNRRAFYRSAPALLADGRRRPLMAVLVDLDDFKRVNDTLGHAAGDQVLVTLARRFSELARGGLVARLGGDEFVALLEWPGADSQGLYEAGRLLTGALAAPVVLPDAGVSVTASVGLASTHGPANLDELLESADAAMYRAKSRRGGGPSEDWRGADPADWPRPEPVDWRYAEPAGGPAGPDFEWLPGRSGSAAVSAGRHGRADA
jgi:diguanylate cyclase